MLLILVLAFQGIRRDFRFHKHLSFLLVPTSIASLYGSLAFGFSFDLSPYGLHNLFGFAAFFASIIPFAIYISRKKLNTYHCLPAYVAAIFAILALISGLIAYAPILLPQASATPAPTPVSFVSPIATPECMPIAEFESSERCLFAIDGTIYDMTEMRTWSDGGHFNAHVCRTSMTQAELDSMLAEAGIRTHQESQARYWGPVVGTLCEN